MVKRALLVAVLIATLSMASCGNDESAPPVAEVPVWAKVAPEQIAEAKKLGVPVAFENHVGMRFVLIPAGTFLMGSPEDEEGRSKDPFWDEVQREVTITQAFYLATTETTQAVWERVMNANPSLVKGETLPVTNVSWDDCQRFVTRLKGVAPRGTYRLPTEAEWEYACRAGTTTAYWSGDKEEDLARVGWYEGNSDWRPHAVGEKPANAWGLHDTHGNAWEWCEDALPGPYVGADLHVERGGGWDFPATCARSANRSDDASGYRYSTLGVRPVCPSTKRCPPDGRKGVSKRPPPNAGASRATGARWPTQNAGTRGS